MSGKHENLHVEISRDWLLMRCVCQPDGCWGWKFRISRNGYGEITRRRNGKKLRLGAHRASYEAFIGPIPKGMMVCHSCDNRKCINPGHLFLGTAKDNMRDAASKGRLRIPSHRPRGVANGRAKLTAGQAKEILGHKGQFSQREIARRFGVSRACVRKILSGASWSTLGAGAQGREARRLGVSGECPQACVS